MTGEPHDRPACRFRPGRWLLLASVVVLIAAAVAAGLRIRAHRTLVARLAAHHGWLEIEPFGPDWLSSVVPHEWRRAFGRVKGVRFKRRFDPVPVTTSRTSIVLWGELELTDEELALLVDDLEKLPSLGSVEICWAPNVGDRGVRALRRIRGLEVLEIELCPVTDAAFDGCSSDWPDLTEVSLMHTKVGDGTARDLARLPRLERLRLDGTTVGDEGAAALATAPRLRSLTLSDTYVTDVGIDALVTRIPTLEVTDD